MPLAYMSHPEISVDDYTAVFPRKVCECLNSAMTGVITVWQGNGDPNDLPAFGNQGDQWEQLDAPGTLWTKGPSGWSVNS